MMEFKYGHVKINSFKIQYHICANKVKLQPKQSIGANNFVVFQTSDMFSL